jgi:hypothetical protein
MLVVRDTNNNAQLSLRIAFTRGAFNIVAARLSYVEKSY